MAQLPFIIDLIYLLMQDLFALKANIYLAINIARKVNQDFRIS